MTDLHRLTAADIARRIRAGTLTATAVVESCIERIREREPSVHAWAHFDAQAALAQARAVDAHRPEGLLAGVPVGVKDVIDTADMPTRYNSAIYADHRPRADAACVALVRRAGGIVLGKTVTTEFASREPGPTRNPHNLEHTPGGSSSGSGAAVADFMAPLGFGTQTGGSTIRPAAYCGVVGYKPSFNTINCAGMKHLAESLDTIGIIGRSVEDCALLVHAVSARPMPDLTSAPDRRPRIGLCRTSRWNKASTATQSFVEAAASALARQGAQVSELELPPDFDRLYDTQRLIADFESARSLAWEYDNHPDLLSEHMRSTLPRNFAIAREDYAEAMRHARESRLRFVDVAKDVDVLLTPSAPDEAPPGIARTGDSLFNRNWTLLGAACVTIPAGRGPQGLPIGIQFVAPYDADQRVLECAHWASQVLA
jgi:Asp-tRNA(Asn)/Glu-tRNA(Gln) amidotransferase A subunit family amidase